MTLALTKNLNPCRECKKTPSVHVRGRAVAIVCADSTCSNKEVVAAPNAKAGEEYWNAKNPKASLGPPRVLPKR